MDGLLIVDWLVLFWEAFEATHEGINNYYNRVIEILPLKLVLTLFRTQKHQRLPSSSGKPKFIRLL
jgi:hypothetical protein